MIHIECVRKGKGIRRGGLSVPCLSDAFGEGNERTAADLSSSMMGPPPHGMMGAEERMEAVRADRTG